MDRAKLIRVARGQEPADLLLANATIVNVLTGEIYPADVAIHDGMIVGVGDAYEALERVDLRGLTLIPGLIEGHIHIESTMLSVPEFTRVVLAHGTTSAIVDPHELANVLGLDGVRMVLRQARQVPLDIRVMLPSCVPASSFESAAAILDVHALAALAGDPGVLGLGEMMNFPGLLEGEADLLAKVALFGPDGHVDGHAPGLQGRDLSAYIVAGPRTDHESTTAAEAEEKLRKGLWLMVREGSTEHNLRDLLPVIQRLRPSRSLFVSDDITPNHLLEHGHLDAILRQAVALGLDPVQAVRMATIQPAQCFGLARRGAIAPGFFADIVAVEDLRGFTVRQVYKDGRLVARDGETILPLPSLDVAGTTGRLRIPPLDRTSFRIPGTAGMARVIGVIPNQIVTEHLLLPAPYSDGELVADPARDIAKLAVIERHGGSGRIGLGLVRGFGLRSGALASSVAHDAHNLVVLGMSDDEMLLAARHVIEQGGGVAVVIGNEVLADLPLPIAGLLSPLPLPEVAARLDALDAAAVRLGSALEHPLMTLSFLALSVIPALKLTDQGLVDVTRFKIVALQD
ncbi:MAG TPA: adenine deaminase [Chloroflexota bacterium]|nr:adenine deaminase [Chloroflexota bacterium]